MLTMNFIGVQNKRDHLVPKAAEDVEAQKYAHELMLNLSPSDSETVVSVSIFIVFHLLCRLLTYI